MSDLEVSITKEMNKFEKAIQKKANERFKRFQHKGPGRHFDRTEKKMVKHYIDQWKKMGSIDSVVSELLEKYKHLYDFYYTSNWTYTKVKNLAAFQPLDYKVYPTIKLTLFLKRETIRARKYTAICGENLKSISKAVYGTESYAEYIYDLNKGFKVCKVDNFVFAKEINLPKIDVPTAILHKRSTLPQKKYLKLSFLDQTPSFSTTIKKVSLGPVFLVTRVFSLRFSGNASLDISAKRKNSKVPANFSIGEESATYAQTLSKVDFGFKITDWSAKSLTCTSAVTNGAFKLTGKLSLDGVFEVGISSLPLKFSAGGWDMTGTLSISGKVLIFLKPPKNVPEPWYSKAADFVADHALEGVLVVVIVVAAPAVISATTLGVAGAALAL